MTFDVYLKQAAISKAENYFAELAKQKLEGMGLLVGQQFKDDKFFVLINDFLTAETNSSAISVRFSPRAFSLLSEQLKNLNECIVIGWAHSHPAYGCFLSQTDINTQLKFFNENFHVAAVFDPAKKEKFQDATAMSKRFYKVEGNAYNELSFAVIK